MSPFWFFCILLFAIPPVAYICFYILALRLVDSVNFLMHFSACIAMMAFCTELNSPLAPIYYVFLFSIFILPSNSPCLYNFLLLFPYCVCCVYLFIYLCIYLLFIYLFVFSLSSPLYMHWSFLFVCSFFSLAQCYPFNHLSGCLAQVSLSSRHLVT